MCGLLYSLRDVLVTKKLITIYFSQKEPTLQTLEEQQTKM